MDGLERYIGGKISTEFSNSVNMGVRERKGSRFLGVTRYGLLLYPF